MTPSLAVYRKSRLVLFVHLARDIKLIHSVFALPFALLATFMAAASTGELPKAAALGLIVLCMVLARTVAMTANRWIDRSIDAANPRTAGRAIPAGRLSARFVLGGAIVCAGGFVLATTGFWILFSNPWPALLSPFVLSWLVFYSFTKRLTWLCHLFLGSALAISPLAATVAIEPAFLHAPDAWLLAVMVMCWVAGFDVIYALADVKVDRQGGLFSMPAKLGEDPALWISRVLHLAALAALVYLVWVSKPLHVGFSFGVAAAAALLLLEHLLVWGSKTHRIPVAFLTVNGIISLVLGALGIMDILCSYT